MTTITYTIEAFSIVLAICLCLWLGFRSDAEAQAAVAVFLAVIGGLLGYVGWCVVKQAPDLSREHEQWCEQKRLGIWREEMK